MHLFSRLGDQLAPAAVPGPIIDALRLGKMTTLQKPNSSIRGIVAGDHPQIGLTHNGPANGSSGEGNRSPPIRTVDLCPMRMRFSRTPDAV